MSCRFADEGMAAGPLAGAVTSGARIEWRPVRRPYGPRQQFTAGREAAAAALEAAGAAERAVPRDLDGRPRFPRGFAGSIAHTDRLAVTVVAPGAMGVGIDIESAAISPRVARFVLRGRERQTLLPPGGAYTPRELFAVKEAAFKALYDAEKLSDFLFWQVELSRSGSGLIASYRGAQVPVWVHSDEKLSLALAIRS
jgi:4'-phosphopantetheinyl transferase EntD